MGCRLLAVGVLAVGNILNLEALVDDGVATVGEVTLTMCLLLVEECKAVILSSSN